MQSLSKRTAVFSESVIRSMTLNENYVGAINLGQGYPDFDPPQVLLNKLKKDEIPHQYELTPGSVAFRNALARKQEKALGKSVDPDTEVLVTNGSTEAMMVTLMTLIEPGDTIVVFNPYYENYVSQAKLIGANVEYVDLKFPEFTVDFEQLELVLKKHPKALVLCNPSNPTGKVFTREELIKIADLVEKYDVYVITDEVYEHIIFDGNEYIYFSTLPRMWERTIACGSLSKTYAITGWRLGYIIAKKEIILRAKKVHDYFTICAPSPLQYAAIAGLEMDDDYYKKLKQLYKQKKDIFVNGLKELGWKVTNPQGAYYILADITPFHPEGDLAFCKKLAREYGVISVPGYCFKPESQTNMIRFHFAKNDESLYEALKRLRKLKNIL